MSNVAINAALTANTAIAINAQATADRAAIVACRQGVKGYQNDTATVEQARQYADCVDRLYPDPMSGSSVMLLKGVIIICFLGVIIGGLWGHLQDEGVFFGALAGFLFAISALVVLALAGFGIYFLFTF